MVSLPTGVAIASHAAVERYPFEDGSLTDAKSAPGLFEQYPAYQSCLRWLDEFVAAPHPDINRPGDVCTRLRYALERNLVWLVTIRTYRSDTNEAVEKGLHLPALFHEIFTEPRAFRSGALLAVFPDVQPDAAAGFIDAGHRALRMEFVKRGLMLGEFHPSSTVASVRNSHFQVMRSPAPLYAVRAMTPHDLMFLDRPDTAPSERVQYLRHFLKHLEGQLTPGTRDRVARSVAAADAIATGRVPC
ncbi:DUF6875 domain-containing protein [Micromonospora sp. WMMD1082]|uniref:DUF6875 domain-containing protein n=1 Tax=Micromonospora sp. WMMD1082 TaxID=3016104 RepID=UPI002415F321|nr:hypothetical protein [Micromonospora sp. WMMD1082]MDG4795134.1 hypothetical protein [Micromonospora sp. WMMD1082]